MLAHQCRAKLHTTLGSVRLFKASSVSRLAQAYSTACRGCGHNLPEDRADQIRFQPEKRLLQFGYMQVHQDPAIQELQGRQILGSRPLDELVSHNSLKLLTKHIRKTSQLCQQCHSGLHGNSAILREPIFWNDKLDELDKLSGRIFYVVDAFDFPLSLDRRVTDQLDRWANIVINKADLVLRGPEDLDRAKRWYASIVSNAYGLENNVIVTSVNKQYGLDDIRKKLGKKNIFIGPTNSGKTSLLSALTNADPRDSSWPWPFKTQEAVALTHAGRLLIDMPSFPEPDNSPLGLYPLLKDRALKKLLQGKPMYKQTSKLNESLSLAIRKSQVANIGTAIAFHGDISENAHVKVTPFVGFEQRGTARVSASLAQVEKINTLTDCREAEWSFLKRDLNKSAYALQCRGHILLSEERRTVLVLARNLGVFRIELRGPLDSSAVLGIYTVPGVKTAISKDPFDKGNKLPSLSTQEIDLLAQFEKNAVYIDYAALRHAHDEVRRKVKRI